MGNNRKRIWYRQGSKLTEEIADTKVPEGALALWNLGQCGFVWKEQVTVYIDPVLNDMTDDAGGSKRLYPVPFSPDMVKGDYVLCTHGHRDHLAVETLTQIASSDSHTKFIIPGAWEKTLIEAGIERERIVTARAGRQLSGIFRHLVRDFFI